MIFFIFVLLVGSCFSDQNFTSDELWGTSCDFGGSCIQYEPNQFDLKTCRFASGTLFNESCVERGKTVGRCCALGNCFLAGKTACALIGGKYTEGAECPCDDVTSSCCLGASCSDTFTELECDQNNGVFNANEPCDSEICSITNVDYGACCNQHQSNVCYFVPENYCSGEWHIGSTCEEIGCNLLTNKSDSNDLELGRCCGNLCYDVPEAECNDGYSYYEVDQRCTNYPCTPTGSCIKKDFCQESLPELFCFFFGGTYLLGGACSQEDIGSCRVGDGCQDIARDSCIPINGIFDNTTKCVPEHGACCSHLTQTCEYGLNVNCNLFLDKFTLGKQCSEILCTPGTCCVSDFCQAGIPENICNNLPFGKYRDTPCDINTGACSQTIEFNNTERVVEQSVHIFNISLTSKASSAIFKNATFDRSKLVLNTNSSILFDHLVISNSTIKIDSSSNIRVSGCLDMEDTELSIDVSDLDFSSKEEINIMQYSCILHEPSITLQGECVEVSTTENLISLFRIACETEKSISGNPLVFSLIVSLAFLII